MGFLDSKAEKSSNPTKRFLEWKGGKDQGYFQYWDKERPNEKGELGANVRVDKLTFVVLEEYATIKGWSDSTQSGIYSNEVYRSGSEPMYVKTFSGEKIAQGLYKDIKQTVLNAGGKFHKSIYVVTSDFELFNFQLKGAALKAWGDFSSNHYTGLKTNWVTLGTPIEGKKGVITYHMPAFQLNGVITEDQLPKVQQQAKVFSDYIGMYLNKEVKDVPKEQQPVYSEDDVPF